MPLPKVGINRITQDSICTMSESDAPLTKHNTKKTAKYEKSQVGSFHASTFGKSEATTGLLEPLTDPNIKAK